MRKFYFPINKQSIAMMGVGVVLNIICYSIATAYSIPFILDAVGVFVVAFLIGPIAASIVAFCSNLIFGALVYCVPTIAAAFVVGFLLYDHDRIDSFRVLGTGFLAGLAASIVALPVTTFFNNGMMGNVWGDALIELLSEYIGAKALCSFGGALFVNIPDKMFSLIMLMLLIRVCKREGVSLKLETENGTDKPELPEKAKKFLGRFFNVLLVMAVAINMVAPLPAYAEDTNYRIDFMSEYAQNLYGVEDGLNSAEINAIAQSGDGYIWAGSYSGLYRYNGISFEQVNLDKRITNVLSLHSDRKGRLWIGTNDSGVACYDPYRGTIDFITTDEGLCSNSIRAIGEDENGNIYIATATHICRIGLAPKTINGKIFEGRVIRDKTDELKENTVKLSFGSVKLMDYDYMEDVSYVKSLTAVDGGKICGITDKGMLFVIENDRLMASKYCDDDNLEYSSITYAGSDTVFVGTSSDKVEYLKYTDGKFVEDSELHVQGVAQSGIVCYNSGFNGYFIGGETGFGFLDRTKQYQSLSTEDFHSAISSILVDRQGNIWVASTKQGISKFSYNPFEDIFRKSGIEPQAVNAVLIDGNSIYVGTDTGALILDKATGKSIDAEIVHRLEGKRIRHILKDSLGNIWFSSYSGDGVLKLEKSGNIKEFNAGNAGTLGSKFRFTMELKDGSLLAASTEGLTYIREDRVVATIGEEQGLSVVKVLSASEDENGALWIGTDGGGLYEIVNAKVLDHYDKEDGLESGVVMKIVNCTGGRIYVASNGLYYHPYGGQIRKLTYFPYTNNYDVYITDDGIAYISSSAGLFSVNEEELLQDDHDYSYTLLNRKRGLTTTLTSNAWNAVEGDKIYLCCTDGVRALSLLNYENFNSHYQIVLRSITKDGEEVKSANGVYTIPAGAGQTVINPAILNYTVSDPLVHIKLEGVDEEGVTMRQSELGEIYYPSIPYGNHKLTIRILNDKGTEVKKEMTFLIHKDAKLYERIYFKVYVCGVLASLLLLFAWFVAKMGNMAVINRQYDQIKEAKEDAEHANQAKSKFLAQMSHEIRTPINAVLGMDEMILRESSEPDIRGYAADIYTAGHTLLSLINDILDSSKIDSGKMEIVPVEYELSTLIRDLVNMITQRAQAKDLKLEVEVDPDLPKVLFGDDVRVRQVITNILTNAVKYTETGTVWLRIGGSREGENLNMHVEVEDTGIGIKEEDIPKLFDEYQRIEEGRNRKIEGTGLGISITVQLLKLMDSKLELKSIYGAGSKFYFDLKQKIVDGTAIGSFEDILSRGGNMSFEDEAFTAPDTKILVVDDNSMNRKVFKSLLKMTQIQVSEASGGKEAIAKAEYEHYDIIFMDHMMPEMDGVETMKQMREMECCNGIPIYVLTANAVAGAREEYIAMGFDGYLAKPVAYDKLAAALKESLPPEQLHPLTAEEREAQQTKKAATPAGPPQLPDVEGLDWNYAWLHLPEEDMLREGVEAFFDTIEAQADKLQEFYEGLTLLQGEEKEAMLGEYRIQVHGMKSGAATIGIVPLAGMAKVLEFAARDGKEDIIFGMHDTFLSEWRSYEDKLRGVFGLGTNAEAGQGDTALLETMLEMLGSAMEDLDVDTADEIMLKMKQFTFGSEIDSLIKKLSGAVKNLDDEAVAEISDAIKTMIK